MLKLMTWIRTSLATHKACLSGPELQDADVLDLLDQSDIRCKDMLMVQVTQVVRGIGETGYLPNDLSPFTPESIH